jgi:hypothetical protein
LAVDESGDAAGFTSGITPARMAVDLPAVVSAGSIDDDKCLGGDAFGSILYQ